MHALAGVSLRSAMITRRSACRSLTRAAESNRRPGSSWCLLLEMASYELSYTRIVAPQDGMVGERAVRVGAYVTPGSKILAVVPLAQAYVVANFQETQLTDVQPGQDVQVRVDSLGGEALSGRVESIAPATGVTFASVKPDNATGNFTKVVQRIPVKIVLDPGQPLAERLRVGMSVEASIDTASARLSMRLRNDEDFC